MFALVACTHSHAHCLALKRSHQAGMSAVFTYRGGAHLIEGLIFMGSTNRTLPFLPQDRLWPHTHGKSSIWHTRPLLFFSFQCFIASDFCPFMVALLSIPSVNLLLPPPHPPPHHHSEMSLIIELSFTYFKWST